jgi:hypothetical protein
MTTSMLITNLPEGKIQKQNSPDYQCEVRGALLHLLYVMNAKS